MPPLLRYFGLAAALALSPGAPAQDAVKTARIDPATPAPERFVVQGSVILDRTQEGKPQFFKGIGYSPYLVGETPLQGANPGDDDRYPEHFAAFREMGVNLLHVFPQRMPPGFFKALDESSLLYGQDIWVEGRQLDLLDPAFQEATLKHIQSVIDHVYSEGRPDRLVFFSVGDEMQANAVINTDQVHPGTTEFHGKHLHLTGRTPAEIAMAQLVDGAMEYELSRYGRRHLYCHTSWTHIGPIADRPDLDVPKEHVLVPDMGDLICLNIYTYAHGVRTSPPGSVTGSTYQGYLEELAATTELPVLITQVGLSTSPNEPKPWVPGFGGHKTEDVPSDFRAIWKDVRTAKGRERFAGMIFFELNDEWWKSGEYDADSKTHEACDPEEWFGVYGLDPDGRLVPKGDIPATLGELFREK